MRLTLIDHAPRNDMIRNPQSEIPENPLLRGVARTAQDGRDGVWCNR
jgi:hypothetical protein